MARSSVASSSNTLLTSCASRTPLAAGTASIRAFSTSRAVAQAKEAEDQEEAFDLATVERVTDEADVLIVGGGPAGLSAAIRIKQLAEEKGEEIRVVLLEKAAEVGEWGA